MSCSSVPVASVTLCSTGIVDPEALVAYGRTRQIRRPLPPE